MKKKMISLALVLTLLLSAAIPVFASSYVSDGYYENSYYEVVDTCRSNYYSSQTFCDSSVYLLKSDVTIYILAIETDNQGNIKYDENGNPVYYDLDFATINGTSTASANSNSGSVNYVISKIKCKHYINGQVVRTISVAAD